jgi:succinyldiaminopimelate transaminase
MEILNSVTENLAPYPMEELKKIKLSLLEKNQKVYDFGTGDPKIPIESFIVDAVKNSLTTESGYPSIVGTSELEKSQLSYLKNRFDLDELENTLMLPTRGSKEAVFHTALCIVGRGGKKRIIYPDPGYPVYESSTLFAGGIPTPYLLSEENDYLLEPWDLDPKVIEETAAIWINYPHNPTGKCVDRDYLERFVKFCRDHDILILSDDCYIDIYHTDYDKPENEDKKPPFILEFGSRNIISLLSLSKRSGLTGHRAGFMIGDERIIAKLKRARSNMGLAQTNFICAGAATAWSDESHVDSRRKVFTERLEFASSELSKIGIAHIKPKATFYLWCKVPDKFSNDDVKFCLELAKKGVITSPSSWLGEKSKGYFRMAMVPDLSTTQKAMTIIKEFLD